MIKYKKRYMILGMSNEEVYKNGCDVYSKSFWCPDRYSYYKTEEEAVTVASELGISEFIVVPYYIQNFFEDETNDNQDD